MMVSFFLREKIEISFDSLADFNVNTPFGTIYFECKRPATNTTILSNLKEALMQINKRGETYDSGVVCLSLSRIIWEKMQGKLLCSRINDINKYIQDLIKPELEDIKNYYDFNVHKKTLLIISDMKVPFINFDTNEIVFFCNKNFNFRYWELHLRPPFSLEVIKRGIIAKAFINQFEK